MSKLCSSYDVSPCGKACKSERIKKNSHCSQCQHETTLRCKCDYCRDRRKVNNGRFSSIPSDNRFFGIQSTTSQEIKPANLTLEQAIVLLALIRCDDFVGGNKQRMFVSSLISAPFVPRGCYAKARIENLGKANILCLSPASHYVFDMLGDEELSALQFPIIWNIPSDALIELVHQIEHCARTMEWPSQWINQLPKMKLSLAFAECQEFYDYCVKKRGLPASAQRSTTLMLNNLLQDHSVAQCYRIIYAGAQAAADFLVRTSCTVQHASNYMIGACQRWVDRARAEKWVVTSFHRNHELPRSMVSYVLYDDFLKCGDDGFSLALDKIDRPQPNSP
ncbi:hypothetical protein [Methylomonas sp. TEB]|uniref:hypothetical protein n=1 Tax=Methylomonas sp. TEB TaxID=3398229 RepID=UPI0039F5C01D